MVREKPWLRNTPGWEKSNGMHHKQIHRRKEKNVQDRGQAMPANHHYEKGNDK